MTPRVLRNTGVKCVEMYMADKDMGDKRQAFDVGQDTCEKLSFGVFHFFHFLHTLRSRVFDRK